MLLWCFAPRSAALHLNVIIQIAPLKFSFSAVTVLVIYIMYFFNLQWIGLLLLLLLINFIVLKFIIKGQRSGETELLLSHPSVADDNQSLYETQGLTSSGLSNGHKDMTISTASSHRGNSIDIRL